MLFDRSAELRDGPRTHALIVAISEYTNLPAHDQPKDELFGLRGLSSSALTGFHIYRWLMKNKDLLAAPLATCELMAAPSRDEIATERALAEVAGRCRLGDFMTAANEWRARARCNKEDSTFFYFCGLGKELADQEPIILLQDFGEASGPLLRGAVSVNNLLYGMSPYHRQPEIARTQLYYFDTSRKPFKDISAFEALNTTPVFDAVPLGMDDRRAAIFFGARAGEHAYGMKGRHSLFSEALLDCLDGKAAIPSNVDEHGKLSWSVTINSLVNALGPALESLKDKYDMGEIKPRFEVGGLVQDAVITKLGSPPEVAVHVAIEPSAVAANCQIRIENDEGQVVKEMSSTETPADLKVVAGYYRCLVRTEGREMTRFFLAAPPRVNWTFSVPLDSAH
jgi:hypothetical protein